MKARREGIFDCLNRVGKTGSEKSRQAGLGNHVSVRQKKR